ncbi:MAG: restriction endonuclease, partial [Nitrospinaceae bacterium]
MKNIRRKRIEHLIKVIPKLTEGQIFWLEKVVQAFNFKHQFKILHGDLLNKPTVISFGEAFLVHHSFSVEPFSKDKFEYVLEKVLKMSGHQAALASKGNRGHDITVDGCPISLKTQADKNIQENKLWISKFMELGKGKWGDDEGDLIGLRELFLEHLKGYERTFTLRALKKGPQWFYELVEIPKGLLEAAQNGELAMQKESKQFPKPGYCYVRTKEGEDLYQLYFDGG